jgi:DNA topoisomerase-1
MDALLLADAMELFKLPRNLGKTTAGEEVVANIGRFGPYVKYGSKYVSLKEDDPYTVTLERALEVIRLKQEADANRIIIDFGVGNIQVLNGRYGPYITDGKKNAKVPKDRDPKSMVLDESRALLAQAPERGKGRFGRGRRGAPAPRVAASGAPAAGGNGGARKPRPPASAPAASSRPRVPANGLAAQAARAAAPRRAKVSAERSNGGAAEGARRRPGGVAKKPTKKAVARKAARKPPAPRPRGLK